MLTCPSPRCRSENPPANPACQRCGLPLQELALLAGHQARLFNEGIGAAQAGRLAKARDLLSAVVHWCPHDVEARNALALASLQLGDREGARAHFSAVLRQAPSNALATRGLAHLDQLPAATATEAQRARIIPRSLEERRRLRILKKQKKRR